MGGSIAPVSATTAPLRRPEGPLFEATQTDTRTHRRAPDLDHGWSLVIAHHPSLVSEQCLPAGLPLAAGTVRLLGRDAPGWPEGLCADPRLSRAHAQLTIDEDNVLIEDLDSRNGTWLRGRRVSQARLDDRDWFTVGSTVYVLRRRSAWHRPRPHPTLTGISAEHAALVAEVETVGPTAATVLLTGPPGVGKERVARAIHTASGRTGAFVALNCGGLSEAVLQSELFGHAAGAFTGARQARTGLVRAAEGGTLLLDEIGDAPEAVQVALLRMLQEREVRPVGADRAVAVDVRVIAATHRSPSDRAARLRADLRGRLEGWPVAVPALRERPDDIVPLVQALAPGARLSRDLVERLLSWTWPGNVRELEAVVARLQTTESAPWPVPPWLDALLAERAAGQAPATAAASSSSEAAERTERPGAEALQAALDVHRGNVRATAQELGVGRTTLYRWMRELGVRPRR
jgi:transcriptional regulator of acetoin/glycerol metabolism